MNLQWDELTARDFPAAVAKAKHTCLLPLGVLEKHGEHLPCGTDIIIAETLAARAAAAEPVVVFPTFQYGQIHEAKQWPGAVAIRHELLFALLENLCDEIARNGFRKIVLLNGHGGNEAWLGAFAFQLLEKPRPYTVYTIRLADYWNPVAEDPDWKKQMVSDFDGHAGEMESSFILAARPELVRMAQLAPPARPLKRLAHLPGSRTSMFWYADFPDHYAGDATHATEEKGEFLVNACVARIVPILRAIKKDRVAPALEKEYFGRIQHGAGAQRRAPKKKR